MERTKQEFKALRELVGMSQATLARQLGVQDRAVRRWESPIAPQHAPQDAWDVLDEAHERQLDILAYALDKVGELHPEMMESTEVVLPYWTSQSDYMEHSTDAMLGVADSDGWTMANATSRALYLLLEDVGIRCRFVAGADAPTKWLASE